MAVIVFFNGPKYTYRFIFQGMQEFFKQSVLFIAIFESRDIEMEVIDSTF